MENEKKIYTIGDAHLDTSWVWTFETTVKDYIPATFNENFALFEKYPEYKFNFEGSYRYELMKEYYPEAFERVKAYIEEGRWHPCGSCYENGDVDIPSPEALIRNVIYGNGFFRDNFNTESNDIFLPDCFGFGKALPSIAAHCGIKGFSTQKLTWGCAVPIPFDVGRWTGLDGKGLWCSLKPRGYTQVYSKIRTDREILNKLKDNAEKYGFNATMDYHGVGDRGGAPKEKSVQTVCNELRENAKNTIKVLSATTKEFFDDLEAMSDEQKAKMPVFDGEFLMTEHGAGSYTTRTTSKRWNRRSELLADAAERNAVAAYLLGAADYPVNVFDTAWKRTIAHQFHDDITGTSWMIDYKRNWNDYVQSMNLFSTEYTAAVKAVSGMMNTAFAKGIPVAVSSPVQTSKTCRQAVSAEICKCRVPESARVFDSDGNEVPSQVSASSREGCVKVTFIAEVPANGIRIYDVRPSADSYAGDTGLSIRDNILENKRYVVKFDKNGDISSVYDKNANRDLLSSPIRMELINDITLYHYSAWEVKYNDIMRRPYAYASEPSYKVVENGPALCVLEIKRKLGDSTVKQYVSIDAESDFVRVYNEVDWRSESTNLKVSFPVNCVADKALYDIGIGYYGRPTNTKPQFEVPAQRWADITKPDGAYGVSILSDSRVGWDKPTMNTIRLTAVHCATNSHSYMTSQHIADFGLNRFSFGIYGHDGKPNYTACAADRFCQPMHAFVCDSHKGKLGSEFSLCSITSDTVRILGIKKAQKTDDVIIRLCEYTGEAQKDVNLRFAFPIEKAAEVTGDEVSLGKEIEIADGALTLAFEPHQIRSIALTFAKPKKAAKKSSAVKLPYDTETSSYNSDRNKAKLVNGYSVPAELIPETLLEGGIEYSFKKDGLNAVTCNGQTIEVPKGAKSMHFILTSISGDKVVPFAVDGKDVNVSVQSCFEAVGAWDLIGLGETGYIKKNPQYFTFTHTHSARGDVIAKQFYLFHAEIPCEDAAEIKLPVNGNILVFAASASKMTNTAKAADEHFDSLEKRKNDYQISGYAKAHLKETRYQKTLDKIVKKVEAADTNEVFTAQRKKSAVDTIKSVKDFTIDARKYVRVARLVAERTIAQYKK